jgi:hypothetical protein
MYSSYFFSATGATRPNRAMVRSEPARRTDRSTASTSLRYVGVSTLSQFGELLRLEVQRPTGPLCAVQLRPGAES